MRKRKINKNKIGKAIDSHYSITKKAQEIKKKSEDLPHLKYKPIKFLIKK